MKRWITHLTIFSYLAVMSWGIVSHTFNYRQAEHVGMYYLVWDMFCGWSAYEIRNRIIAEGESGTYYEVSAPWKQFHPYGELERQHYDSYLNHTQGVANNILKHTNHEPITRVFVVEEVWGKQYNMPDVVWNQCYPHPKNPQTYFRVRSITTGTGDYLFSQNGWLAVAVGNALFDNPRLRADTRKNQPMYAMKPGGETYSEGRVEGSAPFFPVGAPLGN